MTRVVRELVGGPKDGQKVRVEQARREVLIAGLGEVTRIVPAFDFGFGSLRPFIRGRYVLADSGDMEWRPDQ